MTVDPLASAQRVARLREDFDRMFTEPQRTQAAATIDLLGVRVTGRPYAFRLTEISGLFANRAIVSQPSHVTEFLGLSAARGLVVPVYDLAALLGLQRARDPKFVVTAATRDPIGFAFELLEAHLRVPADQIAQTDRPREPSASDTGDLVCEILTEPDGARPIVSIEAATAIVQRKLRLNPGSRSNQR